MRTLVTGGAGFIGSHVVERLVAEGHEVRVLDDLSTGRLENLAAVDDRIAFFHGDVADPAAVDQAITGCLAVVHLAAVASVEASVREPLRTNRANLVGTVTVLDAAAKVGARRFVYASSAAVYGEATILPIAEDAPKRPMSPYAADKLAGEHYLAHYHRLGRLDGTTFRFFNVYGPRQDPLSPYSGVISVFLERVARGLGVTVHGDGSQTRDFVYVADVVEAVWRALSVDADPVGIGATRSGDARTGDALSGHALSDDARTGDGLTGVARSGDARTGAADAGEEVAHDRDLPLMNLGRGTTTDLLDLIESVASVCGRSGQVEVTHGPRRAADIAHSRADVSRLASRFGWVPATPLREGLAATLSRTLSKATTSSG